MEKQRKKRLFTNIYKTFVKIVIICNENSAACFHFSKLIPLVCKTLGFELRKYVFFYK